MKYTLILAAALCFTSCSKKNTKKCWTCLTTNTQVSTLGTKTSYDTLGYCDKSQSEIEEIARLGNFTSTGTNPQGIEIKSTTTTTCN